MAFFVLYLAKKQEGWSKVNNNYLNTRHTKGKQKNAKPEAIAIQSRQLKPTEQLAK